MERTQKVVYVAQNVQQAYLLKNTLEESGIRASVYNASLEGGSGVDYIGWNTLARVVVDELDYETARRIALDYDHAGAAAAERHNHDQPASLSDDQKQDAGEIVHEWPCCPKCGAPRIAHCPVCETTGSDFPEADAEFVWGMGLGEIKDGEDAQAHEDRSEKLVLMCHTCDEPFVPEFPNRCAMCGHRFADGIEFELRAEPPEQIGARVVALIVGLVALFVLLLGYFMWLV